MRFYGYLLRIWTKKDTVHEKRKDALVLISWTMIFSRDYYEKMRIYFLMLLGSTPQRLHIR